MWSAEKEEPVRITTFDDRSFGMPELYYLTKFAVSSGRLVLPLETRTGGVHVLRNRPDASEAGE